MNRAAFVFLMIMMIGNYALGMESASANEYGIVRKEERQEKNTLSEVESFEDFVKRFEAAKKMGNELESAIKLFEESEIGKKHNAACKAVIATRKKLGVQSPALKKQKRSKTFTQKMQNSRVAVALFAGLEKSS